MLTKILKIIGIVIVSILGIYILFVTEECIRLKNGGQVPLFILRDSQYCDGNKMEYMEDRYTSNCKGIGYRIERQYVLDEKSSEDNKIYKPIKEEFWLFDKFLIWGWIS